MPRLSAIWTRLASALRCAGLSVCLLAGGSGLHAPDAQAAVAEVAASQQTEGYARIIMSFDRLPDFDARVTNGVLVVTFAEPVDVQMSKVAVSLPDYLSAARRDPDGRAVRFALNRVVTVNTMQAGEQLFIDILPDTWTGFAPGLPGEVIAELNRKVRQAQEAERQLRRLKQQPFRPVELHVGSNPTFTRLIFELHSSAEARYSQNGHRGQIVVDAPIPFDAAKFAPIVPLDMRNLRATTTDDNLTITFDLDDGIEARTFREGTEFVLDLGHPAEGAALPIVPQIAAAPPPAAAGDEADNAVMDASEVVQTPDAPAVTVPAPRPEAPTRIIATAPPSNPASAVEPEPAPSPAPDTAPAAAVAPSDRVADAGTTVEPKRNTALPNASSKPVPEPDLAVLPEVRPAPTGVALKAGEADVAPPSIRRINDILEVTMPFPSRPPAAAFLRGQTLWMVFDSDYAFDIGLLAYETGGLVTGVEQEKVGRAHVIRLALSEPRLVSFFNDGDAWVLAMADSVVEPSQPIRLTRGYSADGRASVTASLEGLGSVHWLTDPLVGDRLAVVTMQGPARGVIRPHSFVEFRALASAHGVAIQPVADDLSVRPGPVDLIITNDNGLTLSNWSTVRTSMDAPVVRREAPSNMPFEASSWNAARNEPYFAGSTERLRYAASASDKEREKARRDLAHFELAHGRMAEAKSVLDTMEADNARLVDQPDYVMLRAASLIGLRRYEEAARLLDRNSLLDMPEAQLWRAVAETHLDRPSRAREAFRRGEPALRRMPEELQAMFREAAALVAIESRDYATAAIELDAVEAIRPPDGMERRDLLRARIAEGMGQAALALEKYRTIINGRNPIVAAEARFRAIKLRMARGEIAREEALQELETLAAIWRGDKTEALTLAELGTLYAEDKRWRDAFTVLRTALRVYPNMESTRRMHTALTGHFADIYLTDSGLDAIESLALFLDFKELTPPGRRGDEIIRRLADRLVEVDLLTEAGDLLEYQIENRLAGAARSQIAARAALIHLLNNKPAKAYRLLQQTRLAGLPNEVARGRILLEARALADIGRTDFAIELVEALDGTDAQLMKADLLWEARRWQEAGEALEFMLGTRWREPEQLSAAERMNILRAGIAYAMSEDAIGLERLRVKFEGLMAATPDIRAFDVVTAPVESRGAAFAEIARNIAATDSFAGFIEEYRKRHPDVAGGALPPSLSLEPPPAPGNVDTSSRSTPASEQLAAN